MRSSCSGTFADPRSSRLSFSRMRLILDSMFSLELWLLQTSEELGKVIPRDKLCSWPASAGILSLLLKNRENQPNCFVGLGCNPWGIKSRGTHCNSSWIAQGNPSPCFPLGKSVDLGFIGIYNPMPAAELWLIHGPFPKVGAEQSALDLHIPGRRFHFPSLNALLSFSFSLKASQPHSHLHPCL